MQAAEVQREPSAGSLNERLPESVRRRLGEERVAVDRARLTTHTDIDLLGAYRRSWLVVTDDRLLVVDGDDGARVLVALELGRVEEIRTDSGVGSGLLEARIGDRWIDVLRYSNRVAYRFERVARRLDRHLRGEPIEITTEDEVDPRRCGKCGLMLEAPGEICPRCVSRGQVLVRMLRLMRPYRRAALSMMALLVVGVGLDLVSPQLTRYLVDDVLPTASEHGALGERPDVVGAMGQLLLVVVLILAGVQIARAIVNVLNGRLAARVGTAITFDMRARLVEHMEKLSIGFYDKQQVGSLVGRIAYDTEALHGFVAQITGGFILQLLMVAGVFAVMFAMDAELALLALLPAPFVMGGTVFFWRKVYPNYYRFWDANSKQAGALTGMLSGIRVVKAFSQEQRELERFQKASSRLRRTRFHVDASISTFNGVVGILFQLGGWLVWYFGGLEVISRELTLGELMAFFGYLWMFYGPLAALPQLASWVTSFATQANRIFELLDTPVELPEAETPARLEHMEGAVRFDGVSFGYDRHSPVLRNVSFEIPAGQMVGVVGPSGSGKTTTVNLISRFYDVTEGSVSVDGIDVRRISKDDLRRQIGVVLQEPFLFRGSIAENLAYGRPSASPEEIIDAARAACCHGFILHHAHGYDTWLGEGGSGLSGGERQRVGIARALLTNPRILILDEATASVDAESEALIQAALAELVRGRTTIAIAHRLSTLRNADRILVLEHGRLTESGSHDQLIARGGTYARLVKLQGTGERTHRIEAGENDAVSDGGGAPVLPPIGGHRVRWLSPDVARITRDAHGMLRVTIDGEPHQDSVHAVRCMPVHHPDRYVALRRTEPSGRVVDVGVVRALADWGGGARALVEESLRRRYFVHTIQEIRDLELVSNHLSFRADTDVGPMEFTVRWQPDRIQEHGERGKMLFDTDENRYVIPDVTQLSPREQRLLDRFVYW